MYTQFEIARKDFTNICIWARSAFFFLFMLLKPPSVSPFEGFMKQCWLFRFHGSR